MSTAVERFAALWDSLAPIGRAPSGPLDGPAGSGYLRYAWTHGDLDCREWFVEEALDRDLDVETDGNGNIWATWCPAGVDEQMPAVVTGSHLDSVPHGGAYDGPLGVVSALLAVDEMRARGATPTVPLRLAVFTEEEGSRFGVACLGSRLLTGSIAPDKALALTDRDGLRLSDAMRIGGVEPDTVGADPTRLAAIGAFVELHVEQGRWLVDAGQPVGIATAIWPHGRYRFDFRGAGNHAGTTRMDDRHDPMLTYAYTVLAANKEARLAGAHATVGRVSVEPNATNAVPSSVTGWLDARAPDDEILKMLVEAITVKATDRATRDGTQVAVTAESASGATTFDPDLVATLRAVLPDAPLLATGAGHDAGVLASRVPAAMLFVRNPTGVSHAPEETASDEDCTAGVAALADVLTELACR
ncbi:MAG TPA: allantoate amidohydrolase [Micromonosporaceae bacterium]|nr:allantoate amidohydrolase [Micromonosporaceae bacterium]